MRAIILMGCDYNQVQELYTDTIGLFCAAFSRESGSCNMHVVGRNGNYISYIIIILHYLQGRSKHILGGPASGCNPRAWLVNRCGLGVSTVQTASLDLATEGDACRTA